MSTEDVVGAEAGWGERHRWLLVTLAVTLLVVQMTVGMLLSVAGDSPTYDEPADLAAGVAYVYQHDLRFNPEHPPLAKILAALPLRLTGTKVSTESGEYQVADDYGWGRELLFTSGNDPQRLIWLARLPMIALSIVLALIVFGFSRDLFGTRTALVALALTSLCPTVLAHGRLVHTDVAVTTFVVAALWFTWRCRTLGARWFVFAGIALGLALSSKFTALMFLPVVVVLAAWAAWKAACDSDHAGRVASRGRFLPVLVWPLVVLVLAFSTLWGVYLAVDPALRFDRFVATADQASGLPAIVTDILPVPEPFRQGLRFAIYADQAGRGSFLFGEYYIGGKRLFYPALLLIKTPLATLAMWAAALITLFRGRGRGDVWAFVVAPAGFFLLFTVSSDTNIGIRHVLVVPVLLAVASGVLLQKRSAPGLGAVCGALALTAASVWSQHPSYLSYVNEAFGGPQRAYRLVSDSNVDWGQDLRRLAAFLRSEHPGEEAWLAYFGSVPPARYDVPAADASTVALDEIHGLFAISVTIRNSFGPGKYKPLIRGLEPISIVGNSILVYRVP